MPLVYDDEPGSWGRMSKGWPELRFQNLEELDEALRFCVRGPNGKGAVPYGSYVNVSSYSTVTHTSAEPFILRLETEPLKMKVHIHMQEWRKKRRPMKPRKVGRGRFLRRCSP